MQTRTEIHCKNSLEKKLVLCRDAALSHCDLKSSAKYSSEMDPSTSSTSWMKFQIKLHGNTIICMHIHMYIYIYVIICIIINDYMLVTLQASARYLSSSCDYLTHIQEPFEILTHPSMDLRSFLRSESSTPSVLIAAKTLAECATNTFFAVGLSLCESQAVGCRHLVCCTTKNIGCLTSFC